MRILIKLFIHSEANGTINSLHHNKYPKISTQLYYLCFLNSLTFIANPEGIMFLGHSKSVEWIRVPDSIRRTALLSGLPMQHSCMLFSLIQSAGNNSVNLLFNFKVLYLSTSISCSGRKENISSVQKYWAVPNFYILFQVYQTLLTDLRLFQSFPWRLVALLFIFSLVLVPDHFHKNVGFCCCFFRHLTLT